MKIQKSPNNFLFPFGIYSQRKCKPVVSAFLRVVGSSSNKDKDFESSFWQNRRKIWKTEYMPQVFFQMKKNLENNLNFLCGTSL